MIVYSATPLPQRALIRVTLTVIWVLILFGGVTSLFFNTPTAVSEVGLTLATISGSIITVAGALAAFGVAFNRYRYEWAAAWAAAAGMIPYIFSSWVDVYINSLEADQALYSTAAWVFMVLRTQECSAHAAKLRALHGGTGPIHAAQ